MKFTVDLPAFSKMLKHVSQKMPHQKRADVEFNLFACQARVFVECNDTVAGSEALVFEDGFCRLDRAKFQHVLSTYRGQKNLTIEVDAGGLRIGGFTMAVKHFSAHTKSPGKFQEFAVTDLGVLSAKAPSALTPKETHNRVGSTNAGVPPSKVEPEAARKIGDVAMKLARRLCAAPQVSPRNLVALARLMHALERLPRITAGVKVHLSVATRDKSDAGFYIVVTEKKFAAGYGDGVEPAPVYSLSEREESVAGNEEWDWGEVFRWIQRLDEFLKGHKTEELIVRLMDVSRPNCMEYA